MSIPTDTSQGEYDTFMTYIYSIYDINDVRIYQYNSASKLISKIEGYIQNGELFRDLYEVKSIDVDAQTDLDAVNYTSTTIDNEYYENCSKILRYATIFSIFIRNT